jgi:hypothetical protein
MRLRRTWFVFALRRLRSLRQYMPSTHGSRVSEVEDSPLKFSGSPKSPAVSRV